MLHKSVKICENPRNSVKYFAPISGKIINNSLVITEILDPEKVKESNLEIGDVIFKVNAKSIAEIIDEFSQ